MTCLNPRGSARLNPFGRRSGPGRGSGRRVPGSGSRFPQARKRFAPPDSPIPGSHPGPELPARTRTGGRRGDGGDRRGAPARNGAHRPRAGLSGGCRPPEGETACGKSWRGKVFSPALSAGGGASRRQNGPRIGRPRRGSAGAGASPSSSSRPDTPPIAREGRSPRHCDRVVSSM